MKKLIVILLFAMIMVITVTGCNVNETTKKQAEFDFSQFQESLENVSKKHNYVLTENKITPCSSELSFERDFEITVNSNEKIAVFLQYNADKANQGLENFTIDYTFTKLSSSSKFDTDLFVDLANCISGREISLVELDDFIKSSTNKHLEKNNDISDDEQSYNRKALNFFEDWNLHYSLKKDNSCTLTLNGLTKHIFEN